jgi:hypothetical protein
MYLTFFFLTRSLADPKIDPFGDGWGDRIYEVMRYLYIFLICTQFICSMGYVNDLHTINQVPRICFMLPIGMADVLKVSSRFLPE